MSSNSIINYCEKLLIHIKKCCNAMDIDGYVDAGVIGYFIRLPFKKIHRRHFAKIELYTTEIIKYIKDNKIDIKIESFEEFQNSSIIYDPNQISILGYAQYENRTKYLEDLKNKTKELIKIIEANEENK